MDRKRLIWVIVLGIWAVLGLVATGCGGDDEESGSDEAATEAASDEGAEPAEPAAPTKSEYIKAADKLCADADKEKAVKKANADAADADAALAAAGSDASLITPAAQDIADAARGRAKLRRERTAALKKLEPPESGPATAYLKSRESTAKQIDEVAKTADAYAKALDQRTADAYVAAVEAQNAGFTENKKLAEKFGFKVCGQPIK